MGDRKHGWFGEVIGDHLHDPSYLLLRRGARVAIVLPAVYWFVQVFLDLPGGALYSAFAVFSILVFADFGGPTRDRLRANLILSVAGVGLVVIGSEIARWQSLSIVAAFVLVFCIAYAGVLRGYFAAASTAALVPFLLALTSGSDVGEIPERALGWAIGAMAATLAALVLWPAHPRSLLRRRLAETLDEAADTIRLLMDAAGAGDRRIVDQAVTNLQESVDNLHRAFDGRLARPGSGTARDRCLLLTIDELHRLRTVVTVWSTDEQAQLHQPDIDLSVTTIETLQRSADALRHGSGETGFQELADQRSLHEKWMVASVSGPGQPQSAAVLRRDLESSFHVRLASMTTQLIGFHVQGALDTRDRLVAAQAKAAGQASVTFEGRTILDPARKASIRARLAAQWTLDSPWMRNALRTAVALSISVLVASVTGLQHGFWISLGALVALRFDASGTRRTASQMLIGTVAGFVVGSLLVFAVGFDSNLYWVLLPFSVFLAAYTPGAISLAVGQASFAIFVIVLFGLTDPRRFQTGEIRLLDVSLGVLIALVVSALMWPRGISPTVLARLRASVDASSTFLVVAARRFVEGAPLAPEVIQAKREARSELERAEETFDLAISQSGPGVVDLPTWTTMLNVSGQLSFAAEVISVICRIAELPPSCGRSGREFEQYAVDVGDRIQTIVASLSSVESVSTHPVRAAEPFDDRVAELGTVIDQDVTTLAENPGPLFGREVVALSFVGAWLAQCGWLSDRLADRAAEAGPERRPIG